MKCPKCGYLGYERMEKCRNCGYEFSLRSAAPTPDLRLREGDALPRPLDDLELLDAAEPPRDEGRFTDLLPEPDQRHAGVTPGTVAELPLFGAPITDDVPLITRPSPPRPPLAVRRATPEVPRLRSEPRTPLLEWNPEAPSHGPTPGPAGHDDAPVEPRRGSRARRMTAAPVAIPGGLLPASVGARALAAAIDLALLAAVDLVVIYFTMKICGISPAELAMLPKVPLVAFLLVQNGGYLVAFTAVGQTLGKLLTGLRVLADDSDAAPDVGRATLRTAMWLVLALPVGLGLLPAAFSRDGRGLHDRFAGTRVVRAGA